MAKWLVIVFKYIIPIGLLGIPVLLSFETVGRFAAGTTLILFLAVLFLMFRKWSADVKHKDRNERQKVKPESRATKIQVQVVNFFWIFIMLGIANVISHNIGLINSQALYLIFSYTIGIIIDIWRI